MLIFFTSREKKNFFRCFFQLYFVNFWGVLDNVLRPPCWRQRGGFFTKKIGNAKNQFTCFFVFQYFQISVWRSRNLERRYIFLIKAVLQPPCRRYGGDSFTKKMGNAKISSPVSAFFHIRSRLALTKPQTFIYREVQGCVITECLKIWQNKKTQVKYFLIFYLSAWKSHLRSTNRMAIKQLLSNIYTDVRGCVSAKQLRISKNKKPCEVIFRISYLFCNRLTLLSPTGWL